MKKALKKLCVLVIATLAVTILRETLELWIDYDFDYVSGFAVATIFHTSDV